MLQRSILKQIHMKTLIFILTIIQINLLYGQTNEQKISLHTKIDSIITYQLKYVPDSTIHKVKLLHSSTNPYPRIYLNGEMKTLEELEFYAPVKVKELKVYNKNSMTAQALFGAMGKNGAIIINTEKLKTIKR